MQNWEINRWLLRWINITKYRWKHNKWKCVRFPNRHTAFFHPPPSPPSSSSFTFFICFFLKSIHYFFFALNKFVHIFEFAHFVSFLQLSWNQNTKKHNEHTDTYIESLQVAAAFSPVKYKCVTWNVSCTYFFLWLWLTTRRQHSYFLPTYA